MLGGADEAAGPELFPHRLFVEGPDVVPELGVRGFGGSRFRCDFCRAEILGQNGQSFGDGLAVDGHRDVMRPGGSVVGRRDVGPPAAGTAGALDAAEVCFNGGGRVTDQTGDGNADDAALLDPLRRKFHVGAGLKGEPERIAVPAGGLGGVFQPGIFPDCTVGTALEPGDESARREPPDRHGRFIIAVCREEEFFVLPSGPGEHDAAGLRLEGQGGVSGPIGQGEGRVGVVQCAQLLDRERFRAGEHFIEDPAHQRDLPARAVDGQFLPAELRFGRRTGAFARERIADRHDCGQQHHDAQRDADEPEKKALHMYTPLCKKDARGRSKRTAGCALWVFGSYSAASSAADSSAGVSTGSALSSPNSRRSYSSSSFSRRRR